MPASAALEQAARDPVAILAVDDRPEKLALVAELLDSPDWRIVAAHSGEQALRVLLHEDVAVILLDVDMPGMDGYETARVIRGRGKHAHTPIIFLTSYASDETPVAKGYALGAVDYLFAPFQREVLRAKVSVLTELHRLRADAQRRLRTSEHRYAALAEAVPDLVWATDSSGRMTYANRRWIAYTGLDLAAARDARWDGVVHPDDLGRIMAAWADAVAAGGEYQVELRLRRASDGAWRWHLCRGVPRRDDAGRLDGWVGTMTDVHDLRETERRLRWLVENTAEAIWRFDTDGPIPADAPEDEQIEAIYAHAFLGECNAAMARMYGFASCAEMTGMRLERLMPRAEPANIAYLRAFIRNGHHLVDAESSDIAADGTRRDMLNNLIAEIEDGLIVRAWGTSRDITERKRHQRALEARERQLALITDAIPALISYVDRDERYRFVNASYERWYGEPRGAIVGRTLAHVMPAETYARVGAMIRRAIAGEPVAYDARLTYPGVGERDVSVAYEPDRGADGVVHGVVVLVQDVSERKRSEERARFLADATAVLGATLDPDAAMSALARMAVPRIADWCSIDVAEADGELRRVSLHHRDPARLAEAEELRRAYPPRRDAGAYAVLATGEPILAEIDDAKLAAYARDVRELELLRAFGLRWVILAPLRTRGRVIGVVTLIMSESGRRYDEADLAAAVDLAGRAADAIDNSRLYQEAERQRALAAQRADQLAGTNAELEQFAYVSSHDLQEPLRMVTQYMGLLERRYADRLDERGRGFVAYAADGAARMHRLINDLLAYARSGRAAQVFARVDLRALVAEVIGTLAPQIAEKAAAIEVGELPAVRGDRTRLALVVQNLLGNALKFSPAPARVEMTAERRGGEVEIAVADRGIGIEPQFSRRIFEVFQRLHSREQYPGTGIGLAICKKIVEQHGGRIWVEPRPGGGSTFRFVLPADDAVADTGLHRALS